MFYFSSLNTNNYMHDNPSCLFKALLNFAVFSPQNSSCNLCMGFVLLLPVQVIFTLSEQSLLVVMPTLYEVYFAA